MTQLTDDGAGADKVAVLMPGMGAVATTFIAGVVLARRGQAVPVGSLTQLGTVRHAVGGGNGNGGGQPSNGKRHSVVTPISKLVDLAALDSLEFGGWDIFEDDAYAAAERARVLRPEHLALVKPELSAIAPMPAVFDPAFLRRLHGTHVKRGRSKAELVEQLRHDVRTFVRERQCARAVAVWCGSTEVYTEPTAVHQSPAAFERGLLLSDPSIAPSQMYAWACLKEGVPFANGSPNHAVDFPAACELARELHIPIAGKDFKTGQTLMKTIVAPGLASRLLGVHGWYSTNILGNRDGEVLDDPDSFRSKEVSKLSVLESVLDREQQPELYDHIVHKVRIDYYPPRGDDKEGWDNIDLFGWLGYPMQMKINFLCRDSILAAPLVLDLVLFMDLAARMGRAGMQDWLSFYFKSPMHAPGAVPMHDLFMQRRRLDETLLRLAAQAANATSTRAGGYALRDLQEAREGAV